MHPRAAEVAACLRACIKHWKPDATAIRTAASGTSLSSVDLMLRIDRRDPEAAITLLEWLFGAEEGDYKPRDEFDWRPNVQSGTKLRAQWDKLESLMHALKEATNGRAH